MLRKDRLQWTLMVASAAVLCGTAGHAREFASPELAALDCPSLSEAPSLPRVMKDDGSSSCDCECRPSPDEIMGQLPEPRDFPYLIETFRNGVGINVDLVADRLETNAESDQGESWGLRHCHYRATISYVKTIRWNLFWPVSFSRPEQQVIDIHKHYPVELHADPVTGRPVEWSPREE